MTKADIVAIIRDKIISNKKFSKSEVPLKLVSTVIDEFFDVLKINIANGEHVELRGFGTFKTKVREPKKALNPRTKETVDVKRHAVPIFKSGKELKQFVRENFEKTNN